MSATWNLLSRALNEANGKEQLLNYISRAYGEHEADELGPFLDSVWNAEQLPQVARELGNHYGDPQVGEILRKALTSMGVDGRGEPVQKRGRGRPPGTGKNQMAAAAAGKAAPQKKGTAPTPQQPGPQQPWMGARRPDRAGTVGMAMPKHGKDYVPGEKPVHDVGSAQTWQSLQQDQPSQQKLPSTMGRELAPLRGKEKQLQQQIMALKDNPAQKANLVKAEMELNKVQQAIARITATGQSGVEDAQKRVDALNSEYPSTRPGDALAKRLGVPTTKQRTRKVMVKDPETGEEKEKIVVQIWNADKVFKFLSQDPDLKPGTYDPVPVAGTKKDPESGKDVTDPTVDAPWHSGQALPKPEPKDPKGNAAAHIHKPMMKAPKGMDAAGIAHLSGLRQQYAVAKKNNDTEKMAAIKPEIDKIMAGAGEVVDVVRPGRRIGDRWRPSGVGVKTKTSRPDQATGNYIRGTRFTNPEEEGQEVVWDGEDWVLPSVFAVGQGQKNAAGG